MNPTKILPSRNSVPQRANHGWEEAALVVMRNSPSSKGSLCIRLRIRSVRYVISDPCNPWQSQDLCAISQEKGPRPDRSWSFSEATRQWTAKSRFAPCPGGPTVTALPTASSTCEQLCSHT